MGLTVCSKKAKNLAAGWKKLTNFDRYSSKKLKTFKKLPGDHNGNILTVSRKLAKILTVSRKSHNPIETLLVEKPRAVKSQLCGNRKTMVVRETAWHPSFSRDRDPGICNTLHLLLFNLNFAETFVKGRPWAYSRPISENKKPVQLTALLSSSLPGKLHFRCALNRFLTIPWLRNKESHIALHGTTRSARYLWPVLMYCMPMK